MRAARAALPMLLVLALGATACSGGSGNGSANRGRKASTTRVPLEGTNWVLTKGAPAGDVAVTAEFTATTMSGFSGCNTYQAPIARDDPKIEVTGTIATTLIACTDPASRVERADLAALPKVRTYAIDGDQLTLRDLGGKTVLVYRAGGVADIVGDWVATSLYTGNAIQSVATNLTAQLTRSQVTGFDGCNQYHGPAAITPTTIALGPFAGTVRSCPPDVGTQATQFQTALGLARTYEVVGNRLTLFREGGTIAATFERA